MRAREVEEDRLVHGAVLLFEALVFDGHGSAELVVLFIDALQFDSDVAYLLGLPLPAIVNSNIVAFAEAAELVNFIMLRAMQSAISLRAIFRSSRVASRSVLTPTTLVSTVLTSSLVALVASSEWTEVSRAVQLFGRGVIQFRCFLASLLS